MFKIESTCCNLQIETVCLLLDLGANIEARVHNGYTPLYMAAHNGMMRGIRNLAELGANVNARAEGQTTVAIRN